MSGDSRKVKQAGTSAPKAIKSKTDNLVIAPSNKQEVNSVARDSGFLSWFTLS